jgi:hypothetical protein
MQSLKRCFGSIKMGLLQNKNARATGTRKYLKHKIEPP